MYDYYLGGIHNFAADQEAAKAVMDRAPLIPAIARSNRAFLGRAVRYLTSVGVRQFLDLGSGIPTAGNVHEIAQAAIPDARVVYVDIDPEAVSESQELLADNPWATAIRGNLREPQALLDHPQVRKVLDLDQPIGLLLVGVLYFVADDEEAYRVVRTLRSAMPPGSHLVISHATLEEQEIDQRKVRESEDVYRRQTATPLRIRTRGEIARFFEGFELVEPGLTWQTTWRPDPGEVDEFRDNPALSSMLVGVGRLG